MTDIKIGFIFECGPQGADKQVCEYLASQIRPDAKPISCTMDNKPKLLSGAAEVAKMLLDNGCERVLIVWDLRPAWPDKKHKPCRAIERQNLLTALARAQLENRPVYLVCIEQELESWLLADELKLGNFLSTATHHFSIQRVRKPDRIPQPKAEIINHFKQAGRGRYEDLNHAIKVVRNGGLNLQRLRQSESFTRFEDKLKSGV